MLLTSPTPTANHNGPPPPLDILSLKSPISAYYKTITTLSGQKRVFFIYIYDLVLLFLERLS